MVVPPFVLDRGFVGGMDFKWTWYLSKSNLEIKS